MKKLIAFCIVLFLCVALIPQMASAQEYIRIFVNGELVDFSNNAQPVTVNGRILVPLRLIFEKLNTEVTWDSESHTAIAANNDTFVAVAINSKYLVIGKYETKNGSKQIVSQQQKELDVPAQLINGKTMVPLRAISEGLSARVLWDEKTSTVRITYVDAATMLFYKEYPTVPSFENIINKGNSAKYSPDGVAVAYGYDKSDTTTDESLASYIGLLQENGFSLDLSNNDNIKLQKGDVTVILMAESDTYIVLLMPTNTVKENNTVYYKQYPEVPSFDSVIDGTYISTSQEVDPKIGHLTHFIYAPTGITTQILEQYENLLYDNGFQFIGDSNNLVYRKGNFVVALSVDENNNLVVTVAEINTISVQ